jgi:serine/threonine protein kinase
VDRLTFFEHLRQSRLFSEQQLAELPARFADSVPAQDMASTLVEEGLLTRYQAKQIWAGKAKALVLGQYRVLDELGKGGFGEVYKALHTMMDRVVAIKVISPELVEDSRARQWFRREVLASTQFHHPNIVMAYDANEVDDVLFLAMEFVDGPNLDTYVKARGPLPVSLASEMIRQAALALQHAHEKGVVHRDIKPANLLIPQTSLDALSPAAGLCPGVPPPLLVKVVDFGLARLHRTAPAGTLMLQSEKSFMGTPDYVSPEQARNLHAVDIRSDLYSLGCTFYYALTANRPFRGTTVLETIVQHLEKDAEPLEQIRADVKPKLRALLRRLMAKDPEKRFQTPAELVAELMPWCAPDGQRGVMAPVKTTPAPRPPAPKNAEPDATALIPKLAFWNGPNSSERDPGAVVVIRAQAPVGCSSDAVDEGEFAAHPATRLVNVGDLPERQNEEASAQPEVEQCPAGAPAHEEREQVRVSPAPDATSSNGTTHTVPATFRPSAALRRGWREWLGVVEAFAEGSTPQVNEAAYGHLRKTLLDHCRAEAGNAERPPVLRRLETIVEPWLSAQNLAQTDRHTLTSLLSRCQELDEDLLGPRRPAFGPLLGLLALLGVAGVVGWIWSSANWTLSLKPAVAWVRTAFVASPLLFLGVTVPAVLLLAVVVLSRLRS